MFTANPPYHVVQWEENKGSSGITIKIQLIHPDGVSRGIKVEIPDELLVPTRPGYQFVTYILQQDDYKTDSSESLECKTCGEEVEVTNLRDHLEGHHRGAAAFDYEQVRDCFISR